MTMWFGLLVIAVAVAAVLARRQEARPPEVEADNDDDHPLRAAIAPTAEGFVLMSCGPISLASGTLPLRGRLQVYVAAGSQYAVWRQFPQSIRYEVRDPIGQSTMTFDLSRSISDASATHDAYARMPADQIVGTDFQEDVYAVLIGERNAAAGLIPKPGRYDLRAHYLGFASNWVELDVVL